MKHSNSDTSFNKPEDKSEKKDQTSWFPNYPLFDSDISFDKPEDNSEKIDRISWFHVYPFISLLLTVVCVIFVPDTTKNWVDPPAPLPCTQIEIDAKNTRNALLDYLKEYERQDLPTFEVLAEIYNIKVRSNSNVVIAGTWDEPTITVFDTNDLCPKGPSYVVNMRKHMWYWQRY